MASVTGRLFVTTSAAALQAPVLAGMRAAQPGLVSTTAAHAGALIAQWEKEKGAFDPEERAPVDPVVDGLDLVVTSDLRCPDSVYALHARRVPVLLLTDSFEAAEGSQGLTGEQPSGAANLLSLSLLPELTDEAVEAAVRRFLSFPTQRGRVFVVEGGDGAGKQTQVARLVERLREEDYPVATLDYPHDAARYGVLIREALNGHKGALKDVSPLVFAAVYGLNRHDTLPVLNWWVLQGRNVVLDRYMTANFGHQASKYSSDAERNQAIEQLATFEQRWLCLPPAHRVVYLNLPPAFAQRALQADTTRKALDEHEKAGIQYKNNVRSAFCWCCDTFPEWAMVRCVEGEQESDDLSTVEGRRLSRDEVHAAVFGAFAPQLVNKGIHH